MSHVRSPRGRHHSTIARARRYEAVKTLHDSGLRNHEIARRLGISSTYVSDLLRDPDGSKAKERKWRNGGICIDCGGATYGGDGPSLRCADCAAAYQSSQKLWTREAVIDAIQRFAAEHGRPPTATEFQYADLENGYPSSGSVYRSTARSTAPFASWAEAIGAAGFPQPRQGQKPGQGWWDREAVIAACRRWVAEYGTPPSMTQWRNAKNGYPSAKTAAQYFGTWNGMIAAAGFVPRPACRRAA